MPNAQGAVKATVTGAVEALTKYLMVDGGNKKLRDKARKYLEENVSKTGWDNKDVYDTDQYIKLSEVVMDELGYNIDDYTKVCRIIVIDDVREDDVTFLVEEIKNVVARERIVEDGEKTEVDGFKIINDDAEFKTMCQKIVTAKPDVFEHPFSWRTNGQIFENDDAMIDYLEIWFEENSDLSY